MGVARLTTAVVLLTLWLAGCQSDEPGPAARPTTSTPTSTPTQAAVPAYVGRVVRLAGEPSEITLASGSLWVVSHRAATITRFDPATGVVQATVSALHGHLVGVAAGRGHVWSLSVDGQTVQAVNAATNTLDFEVPVHSNGGGLAVAPDGIWFAGTSGTAVRIRGSKVVQTVRVAPAGTYLTPWVAGGRLFVADSDHGRLIVIDTSTSKILQRFDLGGDPGVFLSLRNAVWLGARSGPLRRLDPSTGAVRKTVDSGPVDHLAGCGRLMWVRASAGSVVGLDPVTGKVARRFDDLPASEIPGGGLVCAGGALWVVNWSDRTIWQIPLT